MGFKPIRRDVVLREFLSMKNGRLTQNGTNKLNCDNCARKNAVCSSKDCVNEMFKRLKAFEDKAEQEEKENGKKTN